MGGQVTPKAYVATLSRINKTTECVQTIKWFVTFRTRLFFETRGLLLLKWSDTNKSSALFLRAILALLRQLRCPDSLKRILDDGNLATNEAVPNNTVVAVSRLKLFRVN